MISAVPTISTPTSWSYDLPSSMRHVIRGLRRRFCDLLALGLGLEHRAPVEESVPHGHEVDRAVVVDGRAVHRVHAVDEVVDLLAASS